MVNKAQQEAIQTTDGPVLIIAGPGTGKTFTMVNRIKYMIVEKEIDPSEIMVSTFTKKAGLELVTRLSQLFNENKIKKDINDILIGNFHLISGKILEKYVEYSELSKNFIQINEVEQKYLIRSNIKDFEKICLEKNTLNLKYSENQILKIIKEICDNGILERESENPHKDIILKIVKKYEEILKYNNFVSFEHILFYTYKLLKENPDIANEIKSKIKYIMIDEYQDTNVIQEKILDCILGEEKNICVVGDDDQGLYRFRGASVRNILEFTKKFPNAKKIYLSQNYRSENSIVEFYTNYINNLGVKIDNIEKYRYIKSLKSDYIAEENRVIKYILEDENSWHEKLYQLVLKLKDKVGKLNKIAFLFSSVKHERVLALESFFRKNGISIYKTRSETLFSKVEARELVGAFYRIFEDYISDFELDNFLMDCVEKFDKKVLKNEDIKNFINSMKKFLREEDRYLITNFDIVYRLFRYDPFKSYLEKEDKSKILSGFVDILGSFDKIHPKLSNMNYKNICIAVYYFLFKYIPFLKNEHVYGFDEEVRIPEEDEISFLTIHESKGLEYPIVFMASLWDDIFVSYSKNLLDKNIESITSSKDFEPFEYLKTFEFYRKYYTGFSRAKELLILTGFKGKKTISEPIYDILKNIPAFSEIDKMIFKKSENSEFKINVYSFTTDIVPYNECARSYYYFNKLKFTKPQKMNMLYGTMVHQSIEMLNKFLISGNFIDEKYLKKIVENVCESYRFRNFSKNEDIIEKIFSTVNQYFKNISNIGKPKFSELEISFLIDKSISKNNSYLLKGNIDMVYERDGIHILDFKTGTVLEESLKMKNYFNQINLYTFLYEMSKNTKVESVGLYFTDINKFYSKGKDVYSKDEILEYISSTVKKIEEDTIFHRTNNIEICKKCPMKYHCGRN